MTHTHLSNDTTMTTPAVPIPSVRALPVAVVRPEQPFPHQQDAAIVMVEATRIDTEREQEIARHNTALLESAGPAVVLPSHNQQRQQRRQWRKGPLFRNGVIAFILAVGAIVVAAKLLSSRLRRHHSYGHVVSFLSVTPFDASTTRQPTLCLHDPSWFAHAEIQQDTCDTSLWYYRNDTQQLVVANQRGTSVAYPIPDVGSQASTDMACLTTRCETWRCRPNAWIRLDVTACANATTTTMSSDDNDGIPLRQQQFQVDDYGRIHCHVPHAATNDAAATTTEEDNSNFCIDYYNGGVYCRPCRAPPKVAVGVVPSQYYRGVGQIFHVQDGFWPVPPQHIPPFPQYGVPSQLRLRASGHCLGPHPITKPTIEWITRSQLCDAQQRNDNNVFYYKTDTQQLVREQTDYCLQVPPDDNNSQYLTTGRCAVENRTRMEWYGDALGRIHCAGLEQQLAGGGIELCLDETTNDDFHTFLSCQVCNSSAATQVFALPPGFWGNRMTTTTTTNTEQNAASP